MQQSNVADACTCVRSDILGTTGGRPPVGARGLPSGCWTATRALMAGLVEEGSRLEDRDDGDGAVLDSDRSEGEMRASCPLAALCTLERY